MKLTNKLVLKRGREKSALRSHPWIFSGAVEHVDPGVMPGESVAILTDQGDLVGFGAYSPNSQIRCRVWKFTNQIDEIAFEDSKLIDLIAQRIQNAYLCRQLDKNLNHTNAYRLIHGESDQIPGLIGDVFNQVVVLQFLSSGPDRMRDSITEVVAQVTKAEVVYERSDEEVRSLEGLPERAGILFGDERADQIIISENNLQFYVNYSAGHKTGFYLDQRENRLKLRNYVEGKDVLDCFSYSGGFSLNAVAGGANGVTALDTSGDALQQLKDNLSLNGYEESRVELIQNDAFKQLRLFRDQGRQFDVIILDPPKFAPTRKQVPSASRGYKDINLMAMKLLKRGGILFTFSCSGGVDSALFQKIVAGAAVDAGVDLQILERMSQSSDHPVLVSFPEGEYLKGLICRKL